MESYQFSSDNQLKRKGDNKLHELCAGCKKNRRAKVAGILGENKPKLSAIFVYRLKKSKFEEVRTLGYTYSVLEN